jgi:hypothetical protein
MECKMSGQTVDLHLRNGWKLDAEWQRALKEVWDREMPDAPQPCAVRRGLLAALVGREPIGGVGELRWHVSVQHRDRVPNWEELVQAAHDLRPGVVFVVGVPPRSWWLNVHPHVLHLWETFDEGLVGEYRINAQGARPS